MALWSHNYREQAIPGPNPAGTITEHRPGQKLAKVVTEIQEKVPNAVRSVLGEGLIDEGTAIENNDLVLRLAVDQTLEGVTESIEVVTGGTWPNLQTRALSIEDGLIKEAASGSALPYPEKSLYTGEIIAFEKEWSLSEAGELEIFYKKFNVSAGVVESEGVETGVYRGYATDGIDSPEGVPYISEVKETANSIEFVKKKMIFVKGVLKQIVDDGVYEIETTTCP